MDKKYENLTMCDAFMLSKVMANVKIAKRLMEKLTGTKIYKIEYEKNNIVEYGDKNGGISMVLHLADAVQSVRKIELYIVTEDIFGKGRAIYQFSERCNGVPGLELSGGISRIFVCATKESADGVKDEGLKAFLLYVLNPQERQSNLTKMLEDEVRRIKHNSAYEKEYRQLQHNEAEASQRAYAKAMQEYDNRRRK